MLARTDELDSATLAAARALLDAAFEGEFADSDWEHALGGVHALVWDGDVLVAHAAVVERTLLHGDGPLRAGYVEGVGVAAGHRRRGHGGAVMEAVEAVIRNTYEIGALSATDSAAPLYASRGWLPWQGPTYALTPSGPERTAGDDGSVFVLPAGASLDVTAALTCDWRDGDLW